MPTGGITLNVNPLKWITCKANAGTVYRYPTLNDLYWNPGGNINLKPEQGTSGEGSLQLHQQVKKFYFSVTGTLFSRNIHDWIVWLPGKNQNWSPVNIQQVWSRGMETNTEISYKHKSFKTSLNVLTNYILSTPTQTTLQNDASVNLQIPYAPMYSGSAIFFMEYKNWMIRLACTYTGYRYLTTDHYSYLPPYTLWDARIARTFTMKNFLLNVYAEGNNLFNENYQSYSQYPMPLRNFKAGIIIQYHKPKNKNQNHD